MLLEIAELIGFGQATKARGFAMNNLFGIFQTSLSAVCKVCPFFLRARFCMIIETPLIK